MKKMTKLAFALLGMMTLCGSSCDSTPTSDDVQRDSQEKILAEGTAQAGMPAIKNFRERKMMKMILELRDQEGVVTYLYLENAVPTIIHGHTVAGGKLTYLMEAVGHGLPYATQYTNPQKIADYDHYMGYAILPQADPNGLFSPSSADGTWTFVKDPTPGSTKSGVGYMEPKIITLPFKLPFD